MDKSFVHAVKVAFLAGKLQQPESVRSFKGGSHIFEICAVYIADKCKSGDAAFIGHSHIDAVVEDHRVRLTP